MAYDVTGKYIVWNSYEGIKVWDATTAAMLYQLKAQKGWFSASGKYLFASFSDGTTKIYDLQNGRMVHKLAGTSQTIFSNRDEFDASILWYMGRRPGKCMGCNYEQIDEFAGDKERG